MYNTDIEKILEYEFKQFNLCTKAFRHKSYSAANNQELLEFRGDSILDFVLTEWMLDKFNGQTEGFFGKLWDRMARAENFANIARKLKIHQHIVKKDSVSITDQILADTLEAVVGAIYLDGGLSAAKQFILKHCTDIPEDTDYKTQLQEKTQKLGYTPVYETIQNVGKNNRLVFTAKVTVPAEAIPCSIGQNKRCLHCNQKSLAVFGEGPNKKAAEQLAAKQALEVL